MNVLKTKLWATLVAVLALVACSDDLATPTKTTNDATGTKQVFANLTVGTAGDLRTLFSVPDATTGNIAGLLMSDDNDLMVRVAVKQGDSGTPVCQTLKFTKIAGRNYATYSGQITVPDGGNGEYKIAAVVMSEVDKADETVVKKTYATIDPEDETVVAFSALGASTGIKTVNGNQVEVNVPYSTKWSTITIPSTGTAEASLTFNPLGTILRVRIHNQASSAKTVYGFRISTEAVTLRGVNYMFSKTYNDAPALYPFNSSYIDYTLPAGVSVEANGYSPWFYVWAMPGQGLKTAAPRTVLSVRRTSSAVVKVMDLYQPLTTGSVAITLPYTEANSTGENTNATADYTDISIDDGTTPKLPIEYVTPYALNADKTGFVSDYQIDNANVGWFSFDEAAEAFTLPVTIDGSQYSLPTADEMAGIFPRNLDLTTISGIKVGYNYTNVGEYGIRINGITQNYQADYAKVSNTVSCAIRFKNSSNRYRTAFRYSKIANGTSNAIKVECVHLGASNSATITTIKDDSFWTDNQANIKSAIFPCYGNKYGSILGNSNSGILLLTSTYLTHFSGYTVSITTSNSGLVGGGLFASSAQGQAPVFLFKRN